MSNRIAALPMYDWPERRAEVDRQWAAIRDRLRGDGVDAPEALTRSDDLHAQWRSPDLLVGQTCWGPMECGISDYVQVLAQPGYDGIEGGQGELYSSAIVMRRGVRSPPESPLPLALLRNARFAYNNPDSMSGLRGIMHDLEALGESLEIFNRRIETGGHRNSVRAVATGAADVAAIDCLSWKLALEHESAAQELQVVGWTSKRKGLPFITSKHTPPEVVAALRAALTA